MTSTSRITRTGRSGCTPSPAGWPGVQVDFSGLLQRKHGPSKFAGDRADYRRSFARSCAASTTVSTAGWTRSLARRRSDGPSACSIDTFGACGRGPSGPRPRCTHWCGAGEIMAWASGTPRRSPDRSVRDRDLGSAASALAAAVRKPPPPTTGQGELKRTATSRRIITADTTRSSAETSRSWALTLSLPKTWTEP